MITALFAVSLAMTATLLGAKSYELSTGKAFFLSSVSRTTDPVLRVYGLRLKRIARLFNRKNALLLAHYILEQTIDLSKAAKRRLDSKQSRFLTMVKTRPDIRRKASASFFLKHIKEHKDQLRREEVQK